MRRIKATAAGIAEAASCIRAGGVVAYPTETVYGLGVDPFNVDAVTRLAELKGRPTEMAFILIVGEPEEAEVLCGALSEDARKLMAVFWPGPLSLVLPKGPNVPETVTGGRCEVAVRCPDLAIARDLCRAVGGPVVSTSLNRSGAPPALQLDGVDLAGIDLALDGGPLQPAQPSTVYDVGRAVVLREGPVSGARIAAVLAGTP